MDSWLNPLPAEAVTGATAGAVLGSILGRNDYLTIPTWEHSLFAIQFVFLILTFGILAHFYCAAALLKRNKIKNSCLFGCIFIIAIIIFMYPKHFSIGADAMMMFLPHEYNVLMAGVLILWGATLRVLTGLKQATE